MNKLPGSLNGHSIGIIMREMCWRAMTRIREERYNFEQAQKRGYGGQMNDLVTTADKAAQEIYLKMIQECFPGYGVIAEEDHFRKEGDPFFTVDPLDGTKAFARNQSHGVGSMISLVMDGEVIAAVVGDVNTLEMYYYRPGSNNVWHVIPNGMILSCQEMRAPQPFVPLSEKYLLMRQNPLRASRGVQQLVGQKEEDGLFKDMAVADGSIGVSMARLWRGEVGGHVIPSHHQTPWDWNPVLGISKKLGFELFKVHPHSGSLSIHPPKMVNPLTEIIETHHDILIVHGRHLHEVATI